jgi:transcriptional regulator with XRE-family HTH domain
MIKQDLQFKTPRELQILLGERIRRLRFSRNLDQKSAAAKGGLSVTALRNLESGRGASIETLVRVLKALEYLEGLEILVPVATVNPVTLLRSLKPQMRVRRSRKTDQ